MDQEVLDRVMIHVYTHTYVYFIYIHVGTASIVTIGVDNQEVLDKSDDTCIYTYLRVCYIHTCGYSKHSHNRSGQPGGA